MARASASWKATDTVRGLRTRRSRKFSIRNHARSTSNIGRSNAPIVPSENSNLAPTNTRSWADRRVTLLSAGKTARWKNPKPAGPSSRQSYEAPVPDNFLQKRYGASRSASRHVGIRKDAQWSCGNELALVINSPVQRSSAYTTATTCAAARYRKCAHALYRPTSQSLPRGSGALVPYIEIGATRRRSGARGTIRHSNLARGQRFSRRKLASAKSNAPFTELGQTIFRTPGIGHGAVSPSPVHWQGSATILTHWRNR